MSVSLASVIGTIIAVVLGIVILVMVAVPLMRGIGHIVGRLFRFIGAELSDAFRLVGALLTAIVLVPVALGNVLIGRWSASAHYGRSIQTELAACVASVYRLLIGNPLRLFGAQGLVEGLEQRIPQAVAAAPGPDKPSKKTGLFAGYQIVGSLPGGGSGGKLYVARPDPVKLAGFERAGQFGVVDVVIKSFSLQDGSSLPQIVRESRALEAAKKMGLVLDHEMTGDRFFYVMRYVPGQSLSLAMQQLHAAAGNMGLGQNGIRAALGYGSDLLRTLDAYHKGGLWHKDVKPDNIIVDGPRAHLVDFGLLSHLSSSMTLTTHGTEYFRDPEMVRMSLRGVKVHEVDGAKFDIYAAGAVLYAMVENSFPAHGALSQITKPCPDGLRWIVRRAMTDYDKRYASAAQMLLDLETVRQAADPFAVKPAELPSMRAGLEDTPVTPVDPFVNQAAAAGAAASAPPPPYDAAGRARAKAAIPGVRVTNWFTGRFEVDPSAPTATAPTPPMGQAPPTPPSPAPWPPRPEDIGRMAQNIAAGAYGLADAGLRAAQEAMGRAQHAATPRPQAARRPADEQLKSARERMQDRRRRARERIHSRRTPLSGEFRSGPNRGVGVALIVMAVSGVMLWSFMGARERRAAHDESIAQGWASGPLGVPEAAREALETAHRAMAEARDHVAFAQASSRQALAMTPEVPERPELPELTEFPELPEVPAAPTPAQVRETVEPLIEAAREGAAVLRQAIGDALKPQGRVLVVIDLPKPLSWEQQTVIANLLLPLRAEGYRLVGDVPGTGDGRPDARDLDLTASFLTVRGADPGDSARTRAAVARWIPTTNELDAALWIRSAVRGGTLPSENDPLALSFAVVGADMDSMSDERRENVRRIVRRVTEAMQGDGTR